METRPDDQAGTAPPPPARPGEPRRLLEPEDVLLQDLRHPQTDQIMLPAGTVLTEAYIRKILGLGLLEAALTCMAPARDLRLEALELRRGLPFEYSMYLEGKRVVSDLFEAVRPATLPEQREHVWGRAMSYVGRMVDALLAQDLALFQDFRIYDAYRHAHPLNTATLAILIAEASRIGRPRLVEIGLAGLLADIGKVRVPFQILNKPGKLTPEEQAEARAHADHSRTIVETFRWAAGGVVHTAQHHHERYDGSGYPKGLAGRHIGEEARIVGLADAYDAMLSDVPYRPRMEPAVAFRLVTTSKGFDPHVLAAFCRRVTPYPRGLQVKLNTGQEGVVSKASAEQPFRPTIIVDDAEIDLTQDGRLRITGQSVPRRYHRTAVMLPVRVLTGSGDEYGGMAVNLSLAGICVESGAPAQRRVASLRGATHDTSEEIPPQGEALTVLLPVIGRDATANLEGHLTWVRHGEGEKTTYGLSIIPYSDEDRTLLVDLLLGLP